MEKIDKVEVYYSVFAWIMLIATVIVDIVLIAPYLQDPENGEFVFTYLSDVNYVKVSVVSVVGILMATALFVLSAVRKKQNLNQQLDY